MPGKIKLFLLVSAFLLTMCKAYDQAGPVASANGLSCQNYTDYGLFSAEEGAECFYQCPDGTLRQPSISERFSTESTLYSASKVELDSQFCGLALQPTSTIPSVATDTASPASNATASPTLTPTRASSPTADVSPTVQSPLLTGDVTLCDETLGLISFRMVETAPDLTDKILTVQLADQELTCAVNPVNTSLLTCDLPSPITFPARVVVSLDGAVVNDFTFDGIGCVLIDTPIPASGSTATP
jgi:hypothetical protein